MTFDGAHDDWTVSSGGALLLSSVDVVSVGVCPTGAPASDYLLELAGDGMPPAPATYTSTTGKIRVTGRFTISCLVSAGYTAQLVKDGAPFGATWRGVGVDDQADGLGPWAAGTLVSRLVVPAGEAHVYGVHILGEFNAGGLRNASQIPAGFGEIIVEDEF